MASMPQMRIDSNRKHRDWGGIRVVGGGEAPHAIPPAIPPRISMLISEKNLLFYIIGDTLADHVFLSVCPWGLQSKQALSILVG